MGAGVDRAIDDAVTSDTQNFDEFESASINEGTDRWVDWGSDDGCVLGRHGAGRGGQGLMRACAKLKVRRKAKNTLAPVQTRTSKWKMRDVNCVYINESVQEGAAREDVPT